ncbi:MAG: hypothetical protein RLZZ597_1602 [Cyanobacteriota bacterium]|jgi:hypothetical protein
MTTTPLKTAGPKASLPKTTAKHYTIDMIRDEARQLIESGLVSRHQPIFTLCGYIAAREWPLIEAELEQYDYLLRDCIGDLFPCETWSDD